MSEFMSDFLSGYVDSKNVERANIAARLFGSRNDEAAEFSAAVRGAAVSGAESAVSSSTAGVVAGGGSVGAGVASPDAPAPDAPGDPLRAMVAAHDRAKADATTRAFGLPTEAERTAAAGEAKRAAVAAMMANYEERQEAKAAHVERNTPEAQAAKAAHRMRRYGF